MAEEVKPNCTMCNDTGYVMLPGLPKQFEGIREHLSDKSKGLLDAGLVGHAYQCEFCDASKKE